MQEQKSEQHREWLPADARKDHGCAICAAALPAQKREKNFLKKFKKFYTVQILVVKADSFLALEDGRV